MLSRNKTKILNHAPSSVLPKTKFYFPLRLPSTTYPKGIELMMKFILNCK